MACRPLPHRKGVILWQLTSEGENSQRVYGSAMIYLKGASSIRGNNILCMVTPSQRHRRP